MNLINTYLLLRRDIQRRSDNPCFGSRKQRSDSVKPDFFANPLNYRIDFNFKKGGQPNSDIPFHLSIRFDEGLFAGQIVHNNLKNGNWSDKEERISSPFDKNGPFDLRVRILGGEYKVKIAFLIKILIFLRFTAIVAKSAPLNNARTWMALITSTLTATCPACESSIMVELFFHCHTQLLPA
jgi:hypothetical protein